jgi:hypothetical protein
MFCIAYILQFVNKKILEPLKASDFPFLPSVNSIRTPDGALRGKNRRSTCPFSTPGRCLSVGGCLGPVTHSCVLRGALLPHPKACSFLQFQQPLKKGTIAL